MNNTFALLARPNADLSRTNLSRGEAGGGDAVCTRASRHKRTVYALIFRSFVPALAALLLTGRAVSAPEGELDATFGEHGRAMLGLGDISLSGAGTQQPADGKLLFAGAKVDSFFGDRIAFAVLRLNADGSADTTFGISGTAIVDFDGFYYATATKLAVQPDGKILVVGSVDTGSTNSDFALARLNADGTIDSTFGTHGLVTLDLGGSNDSITDIVLLQDGQFVVVGTTDGNGVQGAAFARFRVDGSLDTSFGTGSIGGTTIVGATVYGAGGEDEPFSMIRQPDGKFVACGTEVQVNNGFDYVADMLAIRVNADGAVDTGFGAHGVSVTSTGRGARACAAMPDGRLVLAGNQGGNLDPGKPALVRLMPDGTLDTTFGVAGVSTFTVGHLALARAIILLGNGALAVGGFTMPLENTNVPTDMFVARVDPNSGVLDPSFGNNGVTIITSGLNGSSSSISGLGLLAQADGKLIAVGADFDSVLTLARIDPAGRGSAGFAGFISATEGIAEGSGNLVVTVRRTGGSTGSLSVDYTTVPHTALGPGDFTPVSGTLSWQYGDMAPKTIIVPITNDAISERTEGFKIVLSNSTGGLSTSVYAVEITDSDSAEGGGNTGGGGSFGIAELIALALIYGIATYQRRRGRLPDSRGLADSRW